MEQSTKGLKYLNIVNGTIQSKTYTFALFTVFVVIVLVLGAIRPTVQKIVQINREIQEKRIINTQLGNKINALTSLSNQYQTRQSDLEALAMIFPAQGNYSLLMSNLENIAQSNGFTLSGINFGSTEKIAIGTSALKPWSLRVNIKGSKANFVNFLQQLEAMPDFPRILRVTFSDNVDKSGLTSYSIELLIFKVDKPNFYKL